MQQWRDTGVAPGIGEHFEIARVAGAGEQPGHEMVKPKEAGHLEASDALQLVLLRPRAYWVDQELRTPPDSTARWDVQPREDRTRPRRLLTPIVASHPLRVILIGPEELKTRALRRRTDVVRQSEARPFPRAHTLVLDPRSVRVGLDEHALILRRVRLITPDIPEMIERDFAVP